MTFLKSRTCLTFAEQIMAHCFKFLSRNFQYCAETAAVEFTHRQFYRREYDTLHRVSHTVQFDFLFVTDV
jgi:hypothetical protein